MQPAQQTVGVNKARHLHVTVSQGLGGPYTRVDFAYMCTILYSDRNFSYSDLYIQAT
jgi:hypothetical protein